MTLDGLLWWFSRLFPAVEAASWLQVPTGEGRIGPDWPSRWAMARGVSLQRHLDGGLIPDLAVLTDADRVPLVIRTLYEHTARFVLDVEPRWTWGFSAASRVWAALYARRWGQLDLPAAGGVRLSNEIWRSTGDSPCSWWVRRYPDNRALYVSRYDVVAVDGEPDPCVRITFPVPGGAWVVLFRVACEADAFVLTESGGKRGGPGLYLVRDGAPARYVRAFREEIRVELAEGGCSASHRMWFVGIPVATLAYRLPLSEWVSSRGTA